MEPVQAVFDAVSTPRRRAILGMVWDDELSAGEIASRFDVSWPAISQNIRVLREAGLLKERRDGYRGRVSDLGAVSGRYVEVDPPRRIVFTWGWEGNDEVPPGSSTVEVTLEEDGDATIIRLRHTGLPSEESRRLHDQGWTHYLSR